MRTAQTNFIRAVGRGVEGVELAVAIQTETHTPNGRANPWNGAEAQVVAAIESGEASDKRHRLEAALRQMLRAQAGGREIVVVCVGATSSTGDVLGPLVGTMIAKRMERRARHKRARQPRLQVLGTLGSPVHATNLFQRTDGIDPRAYVLAVDAAVGVPGKITLTKGPLRPGAGMGKLLPIIGDAHIMGGTAAFPFGIWFADFGAVLEMAEVISEAIFQAAATVTSGVADR